ncbi:Glycosyl phosphatidyl inositol protein transamidase complex subunit [Coemansia sp. RSA 1722]|nr:Glycosyl phosphatidyl inositol protein transamidase complex subunit [Coemansia sp. RSA 486]KAJ2237504.1 Glycosyl phosphatidyl inositol protein transamidase complex subunit [Coemansia sp. RSA 485]KAJ2600929.1 Glycosyl phosphatidyl inositol protein transamidase complex subunit [Coemansia sp. RSA 1721]KAJ2605048.1 Glycosyl phosphatidyl inositol protein transamidase complex subunit [Coemansia sp. RSA 1722]KAJ2638402.1 Glycosyl phosphatidyl inositol protein transamidase complex subunit [Coemansia
MALVLSGQGEKSSPLLQAARKHSAHIGYLLVVAGFLWLLVLPSQTLSRNTYFSENAMMPGQVDVGFGSHSHVDAMRQMDAAADLAGDRRAEQVHAVFESLGLDSEIQRFSSGKGEDLVRGNNVHGVLRAPRSDAVEALVIAASWETTNNGSNFNAVKLLGGLAKYAAEQVYWAKDLVFLVSDSGERGIDEWLRAYHGEGGVLRVRSGLIQAALALELPAVKSYGGVSLHFEGRSGQLPNLDFLNIVKHVARQERLPAVVHALPDAPRTASVAEQYLRSARLLLRQIRAQAVGSAVGVHAPFLRYGIDALTVVGMEHAGGRTSNLVSVGRTVEATLRSLNNLLERFHQSFFFYLLSSDRKFISIGNYVPAVALLAAALLFHAMHLWWFQGPDASRSETPGDRVARINTYHRFLRASLPGSVASFVRVHVMGAILFAVPFALPFVVLTNTTATGYVFTMFVASVTLVLHLADSLWSAQTSAAADWRQLKALTAVYVAWVVACLSVMNFSLAIAVFVVAGLPLIVTRFGDRPTRTQRACMVAMLVAFSPAVVLSMARCLLDHDMADLSLSLFRLFLKDYSYFGSAVYPLICLVCWPVNMLCMVIALMP